MIKSTADQVLSIKESFWKKVANRTTEVMRPLFVSDYHVSTFAGDSGGGELTSYRL